MPEIKTIQELINQHGLTLPHVQYIIQYLSNHPQSKNIPLPGKTASSNDTPRNQAFQYILDYLEENNAPSDLLKKINSNLPEKTRLNLAFQEINQEKTTIETQVASHTQVLIKYQKYLNSLEKTPQTESLQKALKQFNTQINNYHKNLLLLQKSIYQNPLGESLFPDDTFTNSEKRKLVEQLSKSLPFAQSSSSLTPNPDPQVFFKELSKFSENSPELEKFLTLNNTQEQQKKLVNLAQLTNQELQKNHQTSLIEIQKQQNKINSYPSKAIFPKRQQSAQLIAQQIQQNTNLSSKEAEKLSQEIFNQSIISAHLKPLLGKKQPQDPEKLIQKAIKKTTGKTLAKDSALFENLKPFYPLIQSHHHTQYMKAHQNKDVVLFRFLLPSEVKLAAKTNTNPSTATANYKLEIKNFLGIDKSQKPTHQQLLNELQNFYQQESAKDQPNFEKLQTYSFFLNHLQEKIKLQSSGNLLLKTLTNAKSSIRKISSKHQLLKNQAWDYWYSFEEKLPHKWLSRKIDHLAYETKFPGYILAPGYHLNRGWFNLKENFTSNILQNSQEGSLKHWLASRFYEGDYTFSGFLKSSARWGISQAYQRAKKLGSKVIKKGASFLAEQASKLGIEGLIGTLSGPVGAAIAIGAAAIQTAVFLWQNRKQIGDLLKKGALAASGIGFAIYQFIASVIAQAGAAFAGGIVGAVTAGILSVLGIISGGWAVAAVIGAGAAIGWGVGWIMANSSAVLAGASSVISGFFSTITAATTGSAVSGVVITALSAVGISGIIYHITITTAQLPYDQQGNVVAGSPYIKISKKAQGPFDSPNSLHIKNSKLTNNEIKYEVQITAVDKSLQELSISDTLTIWQENASGQVIKRTLQTHSTSTKTLSPEDPPITLQYTQELSPDHADSLLINDVQVETIVEGKIETKTLSYSISIGDPPVLPSAQFAQKLASAIDNCYGSSVTFSDNGACLKNSSDQEIAQVASLIIPILKTSADKYTYTQCVAFAQAVEKATGSTLAPKNANDYIRGAPSGYTYYSGTSGIMPGDLFLIAKGDYAGTWGHIGVVIRNAGSLIITADENWNGKGGARNEAAFPRDEIAGYLRRN